MELWKSIEESFVKWVVPAIAGAVVFGVIAISEVVTAQAQQEKVNEEVKSSLNEVKRDLKTISSVPLIQAEKVRQLEAAVDQLRRQQEKADDKLDRVLDLLIEIKRSK